MQLSCKLSFRHAWHFPDFGAHFGNFVQFCHFLCFVVFTTTNVVEQREIPKTNLAGVKPFEKINCQAIFWLKNFVRPSSVGSPQTLVPRKV